MVLTRFRFPAVVWPVDGAIKRLARSSRRRSSVGGSGRTLNRSQAFWSHPKLLCLQLRVLPSADRGRKEKSYGTFRI